MARPLFEGKTADREKVESKDRGKGYRRIEEGLSIDPGKDLQKKDSV